jgi:hypothetical protein
MGQICDADYWVNNGDFFRKGYQKVTTFAIIYD